MEHPGKQWMFAARLEGHNEAFEHGRVELVRPSEEEPQRLLTDGLHAGER
jgi:hypothetical protein